MPKVPLQSMTLNMLSDGYVGKVFEEGLGSVVKDLIDRGHDGKPRKLVLTLTMVPQDKGRVEIDAQVTTKAPAFRPPKTVAKLDANAGGLMFNPDMAENPDQMTTNDIESK